MKGDERIRTAVCWLRADCAYVARTNTTEEESPC